MTQDGTAVDPYQYSRPAGPSPTHLGGTLGELLDGVLAAGRIGGPVAAWDLWAKALPYWDDHAIRNHNRWLRSKISYEDLVEAEILEYVADNSSMVSQLRKYGVRLTDPGQIEAWFRQAVGQSQRNQGRVEATKATRPEGPTMSAAKLAELKKLLGGG